MPNWDFTGWATKNNVRCSDGRTIRQDAFRDNDGQKVPLLWAHGHNDVENVLGHVLLENRPEGVYAYGKLNDSVKAKAARCALENGDVNSLSIFANRLQQNGGDVLHGRIREVSLVLAGANEQAVIEAVLEHGDGTYEEAMFLSNTLVDLCHADTENEEEKKPMTIQQAIESMSEEQRNAMYALVDAARGGDIQHSAMSMDIETAVGSMNEVQKNALYAIVDYAQKDLAHADTTSKPEEEMTVGEIIDTMTEVQKNAMYAVIAELMNSGGDMAHSEIGDDVIDALGTMTEAQQNAMYALVAEVKDRIEELAEEDDDSDEDDQEDSENDSEEDDEEETPDMKHNAFETEPEATENSLSHDEMMAVVDGIKTYGSLKNSMLQHGIEQIDYLFPDAKTLSATPSFIQREMGWVQKVMGSVHRTPFSRIKSLFADITEEEARARGYIKGALKKDEVFTMLKRVTTPTTVYKKQKFDRDDLVDIVDFDAVAWVRGEMRMMLDEELARAFLIGDGRLTSSDDKINEQNIRPIWTDTDLFSIKALVTVAANADADAVAKQIVRTAVKSRKDYKGSGNLVFYTSDDYLADLLLMEDTTGRVIYDSEEKLKSALRVRDIVTVPQMSGLTRTVETVTRKLAGIIVDLNDYNVGADKGGAVNMFDQFDIDYNAQKYLIETRCSGALTKPFSAIVLEIVTAA